MAKNLSIVANGISGDEGHLLGYNVTDNGIYTPAIGDVARDTTATYVAQDGTIKTAQENVARVDYTNGVAELLLEPSMTNFINYSDDFTQWSYSATSLTPNYAISPDGSQNATRVVFDSDDFMINTTTILSGDRYTASLYIKGNQGDTIILSCGGNDVYHTLSGEWQRIVSTAIVNNNQFTLSVTGGATAREFLVWGAQMEKNNVATSYIPTNGATATRSADSLTNFGSSQIINSSSGILLFEGRALSNNSRFRVISLGNSSGGFINLFYSDEANTIVCSTPSARIEAQILNTTINTKFILKYTVNEIILFANGVQIGQDSFGTSNVVLNKLNFDNGLGNSPFYGRVRQLKHLPFNTDISKL